MALDLVVSPPGEEGCRWLPELELKRIDGLALAFDEGDDDAGSSRSTVSIGRSSCAVTAEPTAFKHQILPAASPKKMK
jgi:hypothetical protein